MIPVNFKHVNCILPGLAMNEDKEEGMDIPVLQAVSGDGDKIQISCWQLNKEDLEELNKTGKIWLAVAGLLMPPVALTANAPLFIEPGTNPENN